MNFTDIDFSEGELLSLVYNTDNSSIVVRAVEFGYYEDEPSPARYRIIFGEVEDVKMPKDVTNQTWEYDYAPNLLDFQCASMPSSERYHVKLFFVEGVSPEGKAILKNHFATFTAKSVEIVKESAANTGA